MARIAVIIPALDEEDAIGPVLDEIPRALGPRVVVVDNGSRDRTAEVARAHGAEVVTEPRRGYGAACLRGLAHVGDACDAVVFLDGDHSDHPDEMSRLLEPILAGSADLVLGSRTLGRREAGALSPQQRFGNWLATGLLHLIWRHRYTDLGPFRAVRAAALRALGMRDRDFGWTIEMQIKAVRAGWRIREVPVSYRCRIGRSKISGTVFGSLRAGWKILYTIGRYALDPQARRAAP